MSTTMRKYSDDQFRRMLSKLAAESSQKELAERYETPMPQLTERVAELEAKVNKHLRKMGFTV